MLTLKQDQRQSQAHLIPLEHNQEMFTQGTLKRSRDINMQVIPKQPTSRHKVISNDAKIITTQDRKQFI